MIVGIAEVMVVANTAGFRKELEDSTAPAFGGLRKDAEVAGEDAGAGLRTGVKKESSKLESDLADVGAASGASLRRGVTEETGKMADDVAKDGERAGAGLHKGMSGGLSKLAGVISATGLPLGGLSTGLEKAGGAAEHADSKSKGLSGTLDHLGGVALAGVAGAGLVVAGVGIHMAEGMQTAEASIASASGTSVTAAKAIGNAFLGTAGQTEFSGEKMAQAYAGVAGQLKATEGRVLDSGDALKVMTASGDLATAKQIDLGDATQTVAGIMQAFQLKASDAGHASDVLYTASNATGQSIDALGAQLIKVRSKLGDTAGPVGDLAGLLVDMTDQGITGRAALAGLNTGMNTLQKTGAGVVTATNDQKAAYEQMPPALQKLADAYRSGTLTSSDFTKATDALPPQQAELAKSFATATTAVQTAQLKFKEMGVTAFDASGKFVGMGSIIDQLHPKFAQLNQQQQLAAATTLFGAGAARQMVAVITAGPAAYDRATASVNKMGAAHNAAAKQSQTLHVEEQTLTAEMGDLAAKIGAVLIPIVTAMIGWFVKATTFVTDHKAALIALAAVVTGILGPAIAVFTVNKMAAFGQSFLTAKGHVADFASGVQTAVSKVIGLFTQQSTAAETAEAKMATATEGMSGAVAAEATEIEGSNTAVDTSFAGTATAATTATATADADVGGMATAVTAADSAIEAENRAAGLSFTALLGPIAAAASALAALDVIHPSSANKAKEFASPSSNPLSQGGSVGVGSGVPSPTSGFTIPVFGGIHIPVGAKGGYIDKPTLMIAGEAGPEMLIPVDDLESIAQQGTALPGLNMKAAISKSGPSASAASAQTPTTWAEALLSKLGDRITQSNVQALVGWEKAEGGNWNNAAKNNPLNTTENAPGASSINSVGVKAYRSWDEGLKATVDTLRNGNFSKILSTLATGSPSTIAAAIGSSPWGTSGSLVRQTIAGTHVGHVGGGSSATGTSSAIAAMLKEAEALIGTPYSKANHAAAFTETTKAVRQLGIDCSGFVSVLLKKGGVDINQALTTQGLPSVLKPGRGKDVTVFDRHTGPTDQEHTLIEIMGKYFESGGNTRYNPSGRVTQLSTAQAQGELAGGGFQAFHPTLSGAGGGAPGLSASTLTKERDALSVAIAKERAAVEKEIVKLENSVKGKGVSQEAKNTAASQISELRSGLGIEIAQQRAALDQQTSAQKAELAKQTADGKSGTSVLNKMLTAIHTGTLKSLQSALTAAHTAGLSKIERDLDHDHSSALASLSKELVAVHKEALAAEGKAELAAYDTAILKAFAAQQAAETATLNRQSTDIQDTAKRQADLIADSTKVFLDKQAAVGLSGTALIAANAQTSLDEVTQSNDQAIDAAQEGVDAAVNGSALAQAQAANVLAQAQATATVQEAQAQAVLDKANAAASSTSSTSTDTTSAPNFSFQIFGNGTLTAAQLFQETAWILRVGALPVAPATPAPTAA